jgi:hypothetical protein
MQTSSELRRRSLIVPREHGAWGILLVPLLTGAFVGLRAGGSAAGLAPFSILALSLFWLRTPVESWSGASPIRARTPGEFRVVRNASFALAVLAFGASIWLFWEWRNLDLLWLGAAAAAAFLLQSGLKRIWRGARTAAQMIGAAGLTSTAPAAFYVVTGRLDRTAWILWAANLMFAINQIQFVQLRIHAARVVDRGSKLSAGRWVLIGQIVVMALGVVCIGELFPWYAAVAFAPVLIRGFAWFAAKPAPLAVQTLGKTELLYAAIFGVCLAFGMRVP